MANPCEIIEQTADFQDVAIPYVSVVSNDSSPIFTTTLALALAVSIAGTSDLSEQSYPSAYLLITEDSALTDTVTTISRQYELAIESGDLIDQALPVNYQFAQEDADLSEQVYATVQIAVTEDAALTDQVTQTAKVRVTSIETAAAFGELPNHYSALVEEYADLGDQVQYGARVYRLATDSTADLSETAYQTARRYILATEDADLSETAYPYQTLRITALDNPALAEGFDLMPPSGIAWTSSAATFAMSRYDGFTFNSMAMVDGKLVALGDSGAYILEGNTDNGAAINATITGDISDAGDPSMKRAAQAYVGYEGGQIAIGIGITPSGTEETYFYELPARNADDPVGGRAVLGRGARSRYWRILVKNVNGSDFTLHDARIMLEPITRKV